MNVTQTKALCKTLKGNIASIFKVFFPDIDKILLIEFVFENGNCSFNHYYLGVGCMGEHCPTQLLSPSGLSTPSPKIKILNLWTNIFLNERTSSFLKVSFPLATHENRISQRFQDEILYSWLEQSWRDAKLLKSVKGKLLRSLRVRRTSNSSMFLNGVTGSPTQGYLQTQKLFLGKNAIARIPCCEV